MRDSYVGDVGDFGKFALLNALAEHDLRLGVLWCRNTEPDSTQDGRFTAYPELRLCDPALYDRLARILSDNQRTLNRVESSGVLPTDTLFFSQTMPAPVLPCFSSAARDAQARSRALWFEAGLKKLAEAQLVFLDPDNGIAGKKAKRHSRSGVKYVFQDEVLEWLNRNQSVVLYQHQQRKNLIDQVSEQREVLAAGKRCHAVSFHRRAVRIYYIFPAKDHERRILERLTRFLAGEWGKHFRLC
jgi:hypothetical protein